MCFAISAPVFALESSTVIYVYDGDTIAVKTGKKIEKVRLLGIDTPERKDKRGVAQCYNKEAKKFLKNQILNKSIRLEKDALAKNRDVYGRLLRYVYLGATLVNADLLKQGYAYTYTRSPIQRLSEFISYEKTAQKHKRGLWSPKTCDGRRY